MLKKAIVLEIREAYVLAMEEGGAIVRLIRRGPLAEGDAIYFLPEDLYQAERLASVTPLYAGRARRSRRGLWMRVGSLAAVLLLFLLAFFPQGQATAYALVSLSGERGVELELSREGTILRAVSDSDAVSEQTLRALQDSSLGESAETLLEYLRAQDELELRLSPFYGYASCKNDQDQANAVYQDMRGKATRTAVELSGAAAFAAPEIMAIPDETLDSFYAAAPRTSSRHRRSGCLPPPGRFPARRRTSAASFAMPI